MKIKPHYLIWILILLGLIGFFILRDPSPSNENLDSSDQLEKLNKELSQTANEVKNKIESSIYDYIEVIKRYKEYTDSANDITDANKAQKEFNKILDEHQFEDSITISYIDAEHNFIYSFIKDEQDPYHLVGSNVMSIRDRKEIDDLNQIMEDTALHFFDPINLVEGYPGIPLNYGVKMDGKSQGYIATILNFRNILAPIYADSILTKRFAFKFKIVDGPEIDQQRVYDQTADYNPLKDSEYYKNFALSDKDFRFTEISVFDLKLKIGAAIKKVHY